VVLDLDRVIVFVATARGFVGGIGVGVGWVIVHVTSRLVVSVGEVEDELVFPFSDLAVSSLGGVVFVMVVVAPVVRVYVVVLSFSLRAKWYSSNDGIWCATAPQTSSGVHCIGMTWQSRRTGFGWGGVGLDAVAKASARPVAANRKTKREFIARSYGGG
jgi:hypothetical protein